MTITKNTAEPMAVRAFEAGHLACSINGYSPSPTEPGFKCPAKSLHNWPRACREPLPESELERYARSARPYGLAVATGYNGLVAIDIDTDDEEVNAVIADALPAPLVGKRGAKGTTWFYRSTVPIRSLQIRAANGTALVDVLSTGRACIIPPTLHPAGHPYTWTTQRTLFDTPSDEQTTIAPDNLDAMVAALRPWMARPRVIEHRPTRPPAPLGEAEYRRYAALARASLAGAAADLAQMAPASGRNCALFAAACRLGKFAAHGILAPGEITTTLARAAEACGLAREDGRGAVAATIASGLGRAVNDSLPDLDGGRRRG